MTRPSARGRARRARGGHTPSPFSASLWLSRALFLYSGQSDVSCGPSQASQHSALPLVFAGVLLAARAAGAGLASELLPREGEDVAEPRPLLRGRNAASRVALLLAEGVAASQTMCRRPLLRLRYEPKRLPGGGDDAEYAPPGAPLAS